MHSDAKDSQKSLKTHITVSINLTPDQTKHFELTKKLSKKSANDMIKSLRDMFNTSNKTFIVLSNVPKHILLECFSSNKEATDILRAFCLIDT